jgi:hypothetical protein
MNKLPASGSLAMAAKAFAALTLTALSALPAMAQTDANAAVKATPNSCQSYAHWQGEGKVTVVDFRGNNPTSPFLFRLKFHGFDSVPSDGFMGPITRGSMTFSYPRQRNPEQPYVKSKPYPAPYTQGPAFGEKISYQAREVACNVFEVHWKEPNKGDTVTHVQDFNRMHVCTNITNINRKPIPAEFDPFDMNSQMNNRTLFPQGSPVAADDFAFYPLCGKMVQSLEKDRVWEDKLGYLVFEAP